MDCEMVTSAHVDLRGKHFNLAGRVVLCEWKDGKAATIIDKFIRRTTEEVDQALLRKQYRYSRIRMAQLLTGDPLEEVQQLVLSTVRGHTLVTLAGCNDFAALGISIPTVTKACVWMELQNEWRKTTYDPVTNAPLSDAPCGLGPIADYLWPGKYVIDHECVRDASVTLEIFMHAHDPESGKLDRQRFDPDLVVSGTEYRKKHRL